MSTPLLLVLSVVAQGEPIDRTFAPTNPLSIVLELPKAEWDKLAGEQPRGPEGLPRCELFRAPQLDDRYEWHGGAAATVTSGAAAVRYENVGLKKKSYCGSFHEQKPSLTLDLDQFNEANKKPAKDQLGFTAVSLGNSKQDADLFRQCAGYQVFRAMGVAVPRCTFASLSRKEGSGQAFLGIYVVVEAVKKDFFKRRPELAGATSLYEFERPDDFTKETLETQQLQVKWPENGSADFQAAVDRLATVADAKGNTAQAMSEVFDLPAFVNFWATEIYLKHWDGFTAINNNTYAFDLPPTEGSSTRFVLLPHGLDQVLQPRRELTVYTTALPARLAWRDDLLRFQLLRTLSTMSQRIDAANVPAFVDSYVPTVRALWKHDDLLTGANEKAGEKADAVKDALADASDDVSAKFGRGFEAPPGGAARNMAFAGSDGCLLGGASVRRGKCSGDDDAQWSFELAELPGRYGFPAATTYRIKSGASCLTAGADARLSLGPCAAPDDDSQRFFFVNRAGDANEVRSFTQEDGCVHQAKDGATLGPCDGGEDNLISIRKFKPECDALRKELHKLEAERALLRHVPMMGKGVVNATMAAPLKAVRKKLADKRCDD